MSQTGIKSIMVGRKDQFVVPYNALVIEDNFNVREELGDIDELAKNIAENGQAQGPYGRGHLGRLASEGKFGRDTLVWTPGQNGWLPADEVPELAQLFTMMPPPLPG